MSLVPLQSTVESSRPACVGTRVAVVDGPRHTPGARPCVLARRLGSPTAWTRALDLMPLLCNIPSLVPDVSIDVSREDGGIGLRLLRHRGLLVLCLLRPACCLIATAWFATGPRLQVQAKPAQLRAPSLTIRRMRFHRRLSDIHMRLHASVTGRSLLYET